MRRRFQKGGVKKVNGSWIGQWRDNGHRRNVLLGRVSQMSKSEAFNRVADALRPINSRQAPFDSKMLLQHFIDGVYFEVQRRRWKRSTRLTVEHRISFHIGSQFGERKLGEIDRDELQSFLDHKGSAGLSFSTVDHLRWDLHQIFGLAVSEGIILKNPADLLITPKHLHIRPKLVMIIEDVNRCFRVLPLPDRLIVKLAVLGGMRPGEILALKWRNLNEQEADVQQRVYRGDLDVPKSRRSRRKVALPNGVSTDIKAWMAASGHSAGIVGLPFRKFTDSNLPRQRLAAIHSSKAQRGWAGLGQFSGDAQNALDSNEQIASGSQVGRRPVRAHSGRQSERIHGSGNCSTKRGGQYAGGGAPKRLMEYFGVLRFPLDCN